MIALVEERRAQVGIAPLCAALGLARATFYRRRGGPPPAPAAPRERRPPRQALTAAERDGVLALLHEERFVDLPPAQVWAQVLDAGQVPPCSIRTMYRVLAANAEVRERRDQLRHPAYHKPELLATGPNQVWSWDITKLLGPVKWTYYYLYVLLDIFSRYVVGWLLARQEIGGPGQGADRRELRAPAHRPRPAHHSCRPRPVDDLAARGPAAGHPGRGALALPAPRLQ